MSRATLGDLINRVQVELGPSAAQALGAEAIQTALDRGRTDWVRLRLTAVHTTTASGSIAYLTYYAQAPGGTPLADWEGLPGPPPTGYQIQSGTWSDITADATADLLTGRFTFLTDHRPPLYLTGFAFDFWQAVGDLLRTYAGLFAEKVDFSSGVQRVNLSQQYQQILQQAQAAYSRRQPRPHRVTRSDSVNAY